MIITSKSVYNAQLIGGGKNGLENDKKKMEPEEMAKNVDACYKVKVEAV